MIDGGYSTQLMIDIISDVNFLSARSKAASRQRSVDTAGAGKDPAWAGTVVSQSISRMSEISSPSHG